MFFDEGLLKQLSFLIGDKPKGVEQILALQSREVLHPSQERVVFVIRPELEVIRSVVFQRQGFKTDKDIYILYVPRRTIECDEELEKAGVRKTAQISNKYEYSYMMRSGLSRSLWI